MLGFSGDLLARQQDPVILLLEPFHGFLLGDPVAETNAALLPAFVADTVTRSAQDYIEVHAIDSNAWIIFDTKINVFLDPKSKVASVRKVSFAQLILTHLETSLQDFFCLGTSDCAVNSNLLIPPDPKGTDSVTSFGKDWSLTSELLKHFGGSRVFVMVIILIILL